MDGIHDLGGRQGFGRIDRDGDEAPFHEPWEGRVWGMVRVMSRAPDWSTDWFRHCRERIAPVDYLTRPYFDQWLQAYSAMMVNSGLLALDEIAARKARFTPDGVSPALRSDQLADASRVVDRYDRPGGTPPRFAVGDAVRLSLRAPAGHTRLPGYARGHRGTVAALRGNHLLPDENARQNPVAEPLYSIALAASDLWPEAPGSADIVRLEVWERYLDRP